MRRLHKRLEQLLGAEAQGWLGQALVQHVGIADGIGRAERALFAVLPDGRDRQQMDGIAAQALDVGQQDDGFEQRAGIPPAVRAWRRAELAVAGVGVGRGHAREQVVNDGLRRPVLAVAALNQRLRRSAEDIFQTAGVKIVGVDRLRGQGAGIDPQAGDMVRQHNRLLILLQPINEVLEHRHVRSDAFHKDAQPPLSGAGMSQAIVDYTAWGPEKANCGWRREAERPGRGRPRAVGTRPPQLRIPHSTRAASGHT